MSTQLVEVRAGSHKEAHVIACGRQYSTEVATNATTTDDTNAFDATIDGWNAVILDRPRDLDTLAIDIFAKDGAGRCLDPSTIRASAA